MRVMIISSDNNKASGAFKCLLDIATGLRDNYNSDVEVILPYDGNGTELLVENDILFKIIRSYNWTVGIEDYKKKKEKIQWRIKEFLNRNAIQKIVNEIKRYKPDIVHINTSWTYVGACAALKTKTPLVWHIREFLEEDQKGRMWDRNYAYSLMSKANQAIAISSAIKNKYDDILKCDINLIYDGVDKLQYYHKHKKFNQQELSLITVGGLYPGKGHEMVIKALYELQVRGYTNYHYKIVGKGPQERKLKELIQKLNLSDKVEFCGFSNNTTEYYKNNDIFLMSSTSEAFGRVTIEAMLNGLYVVGYDSAATSELLGNAQYGLLYTDEKSLVECFEKIINNKLDIESIAKNGQLYAVQRFTSEMNVKNIYNLYQKIMASLGDDRNEN